MALSSIKCTDPALDGRSCTDCSGRVVPVKSWKAVEREEEYVARILQRALGFYIKIRK